MRKNDLGSRVCPFTGVNRCLGEGCLSYQVRNRTKWHFWNGKVTQGGKLLKIHVDFIRTVTEYECKAFGMVVYKKVEDIPEHNDYDKEDWSFKHIVKANETGMAWSRFTEPYS